MVTAQFNGRAYTPLSVDLSTQGLGTLGDPERLAGKLVTLSDGGDVRQPISQGGDGSTVTARLGVGGWTLKINGVPSSSDTSKTGYKRWFQSTEPMGLPPIGESHRCPVPRFWGPGEPAEGFLCRIR